MFSARDYIRFWSRVRMVAVGCAEWTGAKYPSGYGEFWLDGTLHASHRIAWLMANGGALDDPAEYGEAWRADRYGRAEVLSTSGQQATGERVRIVSKAVLWDGSMAAAEAIAQLNGGWHWAGLTGAGLKLYVSEHESVMVPLGSWVVKL